MYFFLLAFVFGLPAMEMEPIGPGREVLPLSRLCELRFLSLYSPARSCIRAEQFLENYYKKYEASLLGKRCKDFVFNVIASDNIAAIETIFWTIPTALRVKSKKGEVDERIYSHDAQWYAAQRGTDAVDIYIKRSDGFFDQKTFYRSAGEHQWIEYIRPRVASADNGIVVCEIGYIDDEKYLTRCLEGVAVDTGVTRYAFCGGIGAIKKDGTAFFNMLKDEIIVRDTATGNQKYSLPVDNMQLTADEQLIVSAKDKNIMIYEALTGTLKHTLRHKNTVLGYCVSNCGSLVVALTKKMLTALNLCTGFSYKIKHGLQGEVQLKGFLDDKRIVTSFKRKKERDADIDIDHMQLWDIAKQVLLANKAIAARGYFGWKDAFVYQRLNNYMSLKELMTLLIIENEYKAKEPINTTRYNLLKDSSSWLAELVQKRYQKQPSTPVASSHDPSSTEGKTLKFLLSKFRGK